MKYIYYISRKLNKMKNKIKLTLSILLFTIGITLITYSVIELNKIIFAL